MKKYIIIEAVLFLMLFVTSRIESTLPFFLNLLALICVPFYPIVMKNRKKETKPERNENEIITKPTESKKLTYDEYLWLQDTEEIGNKFYNAYKEDLEENDDYFMTKKEILDEYYSGDKIYKYEPFSLPYKVEDGKVYSYIKEDEWLYVGSLKKRDLAKYLRSKKAELYLMPNFFKKVFSDDSVETDHGDTYFGMLVVLEKE